jgi:hypothetical protein
MSEKQYNAADETQVRERGNKEKLRRAQELDDVREILRTKGGRRFYWRYLTDCGLFKTSMTGNSQTYFLEGQRNVGLKLLADMNQAAPEAYLLMQQEKDNP